jgi:phasin family protein|tara:strand:+ start:1329 stop:1826 length:498 start_codon:yes stop_codon:yes gene_type:complete
MNDNNKKKENNMFNANNPFEMFDFQKVLSATKFPNLDVNSAGYIDAQKKTLEAMAGASKAVFEGVNAFAGKQVEILNTAISGVKEATAEVAKGNTQESAAKSIELVKKAIVEAQKNVAELSKINEKTANEAYQILNTRFLDGLTELKKVVSEQTAKASVKAETKN